ncbi:hypothetical protein KDA14_03430, partial [Candidatus Saccharibacteria bacterium]|nr:hypothetical protein [Candidatus Saccharibacteria bacterium]
VKKMWAIGDSPHGLQSAHDAGLVTVGYASRMAVGELLDLEQVDAVVDSLESVPELARDIRRRERQLERRHVLAQKMEEASARMH